MDSPKACQLCGGLAGFICTVCSRTYYCSQLCADLDLPEHSPMHYGRAHHGAGGISPAKAREMLANPPHGHPLTDAQRRYFYWIANQ